MSLLPPLSFPPPLSTSMTAGRPTSKSVLEGILADPNYRPAVLIRALLSVNDLLNVRLMSTCMAKWVDEDNHRTFAALYVSPIYSQPTHRQAQAALNDIAKHCIELVVRVTERPDAPMVELRKSSDWAYILRLVCNLTTLTVSAPNSSGGATMASIWIALGKAPMPVFHTLRLRPVHALSMHEFRMDSFSPVPICGSLPKLPLWKVKYLEIQLIRPSPGLTELQQQEVAKALHDYLACFSHGLLELRFNWINRIGENPLTLEHKVYEWVLLEKVWLGNIDVTGSEIARTSRRAPWLCKIMSTSTRGIGGRNALAEFNEAAGWRVIEVDGDRVVGGEVIRGQKRAEEEEQEQYPGAIDIPKPQRRT